MKRNRRLWQWLGVIFVLSFAALGWIGREIYLAAPPVPAAVKTVAGETLFTAAEIRHGQRAWLSAGGQQFGSVWGHGSYVAPDWSADWLHREAVALQDVLARSAHGQAYATLTAAQKAAVDASVREAMRRNTYDPATDTVTIGVERARAIRTVQAHYEALFGDDASLVDLREQYAMVDDVLPDAADRKALAAFFFWAAWSAGTDRPGESGLSYTSNWPHEPLVGIFWIATAWLATGLYIAPLLSGHEPKLQKLGVDALFWALVLVVVGSTAFGWLGTLQKQGVDFSFWLGNQGLEFTSMGRVWQVLLFLGLLFWLFLLGRALWPALKKPSETRGLVAMVFLSATCIGGFYATSLTWGQNTHYSMIEYWRWWLVHLWVEGFFEVFATAVVALIGFEGWKNYRRSRAAPWVAAYRWPILCFVAVGFWNVVGAGLLGFAINPPAFLYFVQGLNLTPAHGHAALFGVYGMLGIGLMLFCLRGLFERSLHSDRLLAPAFWGLNGGLAMMVFMSLLPAGIYQAWASVSTGLWYARSPEIVHSKLMELLVWLRVPGDVVFSVGSVLLAIYALRLLRRGASAAGKARQMLQPS